MLHTVQLYYNKRGFSEVSTIFARRGDTGELISTNFKNDINDAATSIDADATFDVAKVFFEAEGDGVFVRREIPAKYLDLSIPKKPKIKAFPLPAEMFAKGPNTVENCYFRFQLKTGAPTLETETPAEISSSSFTTIVLGSPIPGIRSYYLDEINQLILDFEAAIAGYTPADIEEFYKELKAEIELAKKQAKQDIEDLNAIFVQAEADLKASIAKEIADMNTIIQNMQTSLDAQLLELQKQIDATKLQVTEIDKHLVQVDLDITNAKKEIEQVKTDTTAEINKAKTDAATEMAKIKKESIDAVVAEKNAVIKMINDLKAEIAAMDLEQLVLDLFAQGKVKDVMVAEIQKEVTKQLSDKGAASQTWVDENFISSDGKKNNIKTSNLFSYQDIVPSSLVSVIKENSALFSGWANVFVYNAKLPLYLTEGKEYTISYKYIPRKMTENTVPAAQANHGCLALYSGISGKPFIPLYDDGEIKVQKLELDKPLYRTWDFVCPKLDPSEGYNLIAYATRQMTPDGKTFVVTDPGEFVDVMITEKGVQGEWSIPERDLLSLSTGHRWFDTTSNKSIETVERYDANIINSRDWVYTRQLLNGPNFPGVGSNGFVKTVSMGDKFSETYFNPLDSVRMFKRSIISGTARPWQEIYNSESFPGQATKITADNGGIIQNFNDSSKEAIWQLNTLLNGVHYIMMQTSKGQPEKWIYGIFTKNGGASGNFIGCATGTGNPYSYSYNNGVNSGWSRLDGQVQKITANDGGYTSLKGEGRTTLQALQSLGKGIHFVYLTTNYKDLPTEYIAGIAHVLTTTAQEVTFIGESMIEDRGTYAFNGKSNTWKRLDGQVAKITQDNGKSKDVWTNSFDLWEKIRTLGSGFHTVFATNTNNQLPINDARYMMVVQIHEMSESSGYISYGRITAYNTFDGSTYVQTIRDNDLKGWVRLDNVLPPIATQTQNGLLSSTDKKKLDDLKAYNDATQTTSGLMSYTDKKKLDNISGPLAPLKKVTKTGIGVKNIQIISYEVSHGVIECQLKFNKNGQFSSTASQFFDLDVDTFCKTISQETLNTLVGCHLQGSADGSAGGTGAFKVPIAGMLVQNQSRVAVTLRVDSTDTSKYLAENAEVDLRFTIYEVGA